MRTLLRDGEPWFVAADIAAALDYAEAKDMTRNLEDDEKGRQIVPTPGGNQEMTIINESGLFAAVLKSRKPEAQRFRRWVTSEVLPAIRKTGGYRQSATVELSRMEILRLDAMATRTTITSALASSCGGPACKRLSPSLMRGITQFPPSHLFQAEREEPTPPCGLFHVIGYSENGQRVTWIAP